MKRIRTAWKGILPGSDRLALGAFILALACTMFAVGAVFAKKELPPYPALADVFRDAREAWRTLSGARPQIVMPIEHPGEGVTRIERGAMQPGLTLIQATFADGPRLFLIDAAGMVMHRWPVDFFEVWPDPDHVVPEDQVPASARNLHMHGVALQPDGSALINFDYLGAVKIDSCGEVLWTIDRRTHHAIEPAEDGTFWIPAVRNVREIDGDLLLPGVTREGLLNSEGRYEDLVLRVSEDGEVLEEFSVLETLFKDGREAELFDAAQIDPYDPTHLNDIEVVTPALANLIEGVSAGDLLISLRNLHMLAILERESGALLWAKRGPWVRQHDPDIRPDGRIAVFDNGWDQLQSARRLPGSRILLYDPRTGQAQTLVPQEEDQIFYTQFVGKHQRLPNGNLLITESMAGRVFELDPEGQIVWEYVARYDDSHAALIEAAHRYPPDALEVGAWRCPAGVAAAE